MSSVEPRRLAVPWPLPSLVSHHRPVPPSCSSLNTRSSLLAQHRGLCCSLSFGCSSPRHLQDWFPHSVQVAVRCHRLRPCDSISPSSSLSHHHPMMKEMLRCLDYFLESSRHRNVLQVLSYSRMKEPRFYRVRVSRSCSARTPSVGLCGWLSLTTSGWSDGLSSERNRIHSTGAVESSPRVGCCSRRPGFSQLRKSISPDTSLVTMETGDKPTYDRVGDGGEAACFITLLGGLPGRMILGNSEHPPPCRALSFFLCLNYCLQGQEEGRGGGLRDGGFTGVRSRPSLAPTGEPTLRCGQRAKKLGETTI